MFLMTLTTALLSLVVPTVSMLAQSTTVSAQPHRAASMAVDSSTCFPRCLSHFYSFISLRCEEVFNHTKKIKAQLPSANHKLEETHTKT